MNEQFLDNLKEDLRKVFGRDLSEKELEIYGDRLRRQRVQIQRLETWENKLWLTEPATVSALLSNVGGSDGKR